tara:strand:- start:1221 stop:2453 length:1233 start_codon:yes stop_codon:yes gene_type:complete
MNYYISTLYIAIPVFMILIILEETIARVRRIGINRAEDMISSLSSGLTNILRDGLKLTVILITYTWLVDHIAIITLQPVWLAVAIAFLVQDFSGYWMHRLNHRVNIFWNRHVIHHSSEEFNLSCALRQSISNTLQFSAIFMIPAALLNIPSKYFAIMGPIHLFMQFWYHTQLIGKMGWLEYVLVTPSHHRVHHAINSMYLDKNYSQIFIFWDKLFGTFQKELKDEKPVYGVLRPAGTWNPILINYKHIWQIMQDAWHTSTFFNKMIIWFMPTGWRPADVSMKFPIKTIDISKNQKKYSTNNSTLIIMWAWIQLIITFFLMFHLFTIMESFDSMMVYLYASVILINIFTFTAMLDGKDYAIKAELLKLGLIIFIFLMQGFTWYGLDGLYLAILIGYFFTSIFSIYVFSNRK